MRALGWKVALLISKGLRHQAQPKTENSIRKFFISHSRVQPKTRVKLQACSEDFPMNAENQGDSFCGYANHTPPRQPERANSPRLSKRGILEPRVKARHSNPSRDEAVYRVKQLFPRHNFSLFRPNELLRQESQYEHPP